MHSRWAKLAQPTHPLTHRKQNTILRQNVRKISRIKSMIYYGKTFNTTKMVTKSVRNQNMDSEKAVMVVMGDGITLLVLAELR